MVTVDICNSYITLKHFQVFENTHMETSTHTWKNSVLEVRQCPPKNSENHQKTVQSPRINKTISIKAQRYCQKV